MDIAPAWSVALGTAAGLAIGAAAGWFVQKRAGANAGHPGLTVDGDDIVITNTLDEEIFLVKIAANVQFALAFKGRADGEREAEHWFRRSRTCRQSIGPKSQVRLQLLLKTAAKPATVSLTFDFSSGMFRTARARVRIPRMQKSEVVLP